MSWYPNNDIAKSLDPNFKNDSSYISLASCTDFELGEDMKNKRKLRL
jgi:hypothetical protein